MKEETIKIAKSLDFISGKLNHLTPVELVWKDEGPLGPVWVTFKEMEKDNFFKVILPISRNYQNGPKISGEQRYFATWFTYNQAQKIAKKLNLPLTPC